MMRSTRGSGCQCSRTAELDVLGQEEGRSVCATHSEQREAGKWESRVYLKFNGREIRRDVQLCLVWKLRRGGWGMMTDLEIRPVRLR